ncbi:putative LRR receptor-like serine/threonine-protein kinase [Nymphaea thermarum]|nr:putative LRR receptor-like serine/threonine-protein kinase [Nymphaea thermarum]
MAYNFNCDQFSDYVTRKRKDVECKSIIVRDGGKEEEVKNRVKEEKEDRVGEEDQSNRHQKLPGHDYSLFINCGGNPYTSHGNTYEGDTEPSGESMFFYSPTKTWAFTSTGRSIDSQSFDYVVTNSTRLLMADPTLYMNARSSPITMTYYGLCLQKGIYNVTLHFAEIIFTNDQTYSSLGERIFDVSIQVST